MLVSYPSRWSFSFTLGPLHWSSIFITSREQRNIVQLCTRLMLDRAILRWGDIFFLWYRCPPVWSFLFSSIFNKNVNKEISNNNHPEITVAAEREQFAMQWTWLKCNIFVGFSNIFFVERLSFATFVWDGGDRCKMRWDCEDDIYGKRWTLGGDQPLVSDLGS